MYAFRYVWGGPAYVGVMAQDLLVARPEAVIVTDSGYLMVDYDLIDVKMMTLTDYRKRERRLAAQCGSTVDRSKQGCLA
ncbi:hypothetical protein [Methylovirgula sp. 4M-Z18]|uniref:hypothetical protein n=1 Tax=Methylovirgula sp. 4M-Z18 TaxID=2293567 RepID=UPI001314A50D|nr:hypothetical protein [Methylovirgula sp. 4M-Z18]